MLTTVTGMLEGLGYDTITTTDGPSALRVLVETGALDGLLSDIGLPGELSGLDLAQIAAETRPELKIATMSGYKEERPAAGGGDEELARAPSNQAVRARRSRRRHGGAVHVRRQDVMNPTA